MSLSKQAQRLGLRVLGFGVFRASGLGLRMWGLGLRFQGLVFGLFGGRSLLSGLADYLVSK